jgi:hemerythrin-like domain-containing protein
MPVKIGQTADHGFESPLGLLSDCHRRIEQFLSALVTIADVRGGAGLSPEDRRALEGALHYFQAAAPRHTADEEESLFPRLRASGDPEAVAAIESLRRLEADHKVAEDHHDMVECLGRRWLSAGTLSGRDTHLLREHLGALVRLYRGHIQVEDTQLFPAAARVLTGEDLKAVGREMAHRRNVPFSPPPDLAE